MTNVIKILFKTSKIHYTTKHNVEKSKAASSKKYQTQFTL